MLSRDSIFVITLLGGEGGDDELNWPASSVWDFIAQLGEHCSANAEATGSIRIPLKPRKSFFGGLLRNCLNSDFNCDGHIFISFVFLQLT